jgi:AcrR family transcriptional regulator
MALVSVMPSHLLETQTSSSRARLLDAAKRLFAAHGYEQSATSAIAREAGTSESQLMRYFGGKVGLLEALFEDAWTHLNARVARATATSDARHAILNGIQAVVSALARDPDLAVLLMFEGRRRRGDEQRVRLSRGFVHFTETMRNLVKKSQTLGEIDSALDPNAVTSAVLGATEAMIRDRLLARSGTGRGFAEREIRRTVAEMLNGLRGTTPPRPSRRRLRRTSQR